MPDSKEAVQQRILDSIPDEYDKTEGSFFYDLASALAIEMSLAYTRTDEVKELGFAQTTSEQYLDYRAGEHGLTRKAATKATGQVTITGSNGTTVPVGSTFVTGAGVQFTTTAEASIGEPGQVNAPVVAVLAGTGGNVPAATITGIPVSIPGVNGVTNTAPTTGGTDTETDQALLARLLEKVRLPATSGNVAHYLQWAKEVAGVGDAKVFPIWDGPGTVKVVVIDSNKQPASGDIVQDVADYIEEIRPIGATVTVESATGLSIDVSATVVLDVDAVLADVKAAFETKLTEYLAGIAFVQSYVSAAQVGNLLLSIPGVLDYSGLTLNGEGGNVAVGDTQVAVKRVVTLNE